MKWPRVKSERGAICAFYSTSVAVLPACAGFVLLVLVPVVHAGTFSLHAEYSVCDQNNHWRASRFRTKFELCAIVLHSDAAAL